MRFTTAIFDLDGTLLNTLEDLAQASNRVLAQYGYPQHQQEKYRFFVGDGLKTLMERITPPGLSETELADCCALFEQIYSNCWADVTRPYPGIVEMLTNLERQGIRLAVLSNKPHQFTQACVNYFFSDFRFDPVLGVRAGIEKKPNPAGALEIARLHDSSPGQCLYIGDTSVDMRTGKAAGMFTIGVTWGFRPYEELAENDADLIVNNPEEIVSHAVSAN